MGSAAEATYQSVIAYFARRLMRDFRLVGDEAVLYGKLKQFIADGLFHIPVDLENPNTLRNLSEDAAVKSLMETFKTAINRLTVQETGDVEIRDSIKLSKARPSVVSPGPFLVPKKSIFTKVVPDQGFELRVAAFLDACPDIVSFAKNTQSTGFRIEYRNAEGGIANYYPDFIVKQTPSDLWIIETKGREDLDDPPKRERLGQWCEDASRHDPTRRYRSLFIREEDWDAYTPRAFADLARTFGG